MAFIHTTRLPIFASALKILREPEPEAVNMTLQAALIKPNEWAPRCADAVRYCLQEVATAATEMRRRRQTTEAFRQWMKQERALEDMGYVNGDAEIPGLTDPGSVPLGHFGFASLLFRNR